MEACCATTMKISKSVTMVRRERRTCAIEKDLSICVMKNLDKVRITVYSQLAVWINMVKIKEPWNVRNLVRQIRSHCETITQWRIGYVYRETNKAADWLATRVNSEGFTFFRDLY